MIKEQAPLGSIHLRPVFCWRLTALQPEMFAIIIIIIINFILIWHS